MKTIIRIIALSVALLSCNKEPAEEPNAEFVILKRTPEGTQEVDTISYGETVILKAKHRSEHIVFYNGKIGYKYDRRTEIDPVYRNTGLSANNGELTVRYTMNIPPKEAITYTVVCVATNYGSWAKEELSRVEKKTLVVMPLP